MKTIEECFAFDTLSPKCHLTAFRVKKQNVGREGDEHVEFEVRLYSDEKRASGFVVLAGPYYRRETVNEAFIRCRETLSAFMRSGLPIDPVQP